MKKKPNKWSRNIDRIPIQEPRFEIEQKKPKTVIFRCQREFHQNDADSFPSVPHGHAIGKHLKLELWSGNVYQRKSKKPCGRAKPDEMKELYSEKGFKEFVDRCREIYKESHPYRPLPTLSPLRSNIGVSRAQRLRSTGNSRMTVAVPTTYRCDIEIVLYKSGSSGTGGRTTRKYTRRKKQPTKRKRYL